MEKLTRCFLLLAVLNFVSAEDAFFREGGELLLRPRIYREITSIQWKHNNNLVGEWVKDVVDLMYYGEFKGRTTMNPTTGSLEIRNMRPVDGGEYSVEINNRPQPEHYNAKLIKAVPKPDVLVRPLVCSTASEKCTLTCYGNTEEAEPVTYSWKMGEGEWMDGEKDWTITNNEKTQSVEIISCRMKNPVSEEESDLIPNPFFREKGLIVIKAVPKPVVLVKPLNCAARSEKCILTCYGNTEKAEPVTYSWKMGEGEWMDGEKDRSITNNEKTQSVENVSCRMKNPVSEKESDPKPNPFFREKGLIVIKAVPKPVVLVKPLNCAARSEKCILTCYGNTEKAEPVTYSWKMGEGEWMDGEKDRSITNNEKTQSVEIISCRMKNPVSEKESDLIPNPFFREKGSIVIKAVPKPVVLVKPLNCAARSEKCILTCYGNTEKAEPVTYSWKMGEGEWMDGEKDRIITNDGTIQSVEIVSCQIKNPISEEESDPKPNPFFGPGSSGVGLPVDLFLLVVGILAVVVGAEF